MNILSVNSGSSSIRLSVFFKGREKLQLVYDRKYTLNDKSHEEVLQAFIKESGVKELDVASHRVVHGGSRFISPILINSEVEDEIGFLSGLAPLHNPVALSWIRTCRDVLGQDISQVAVFDTSFYADMPEVSKTYALPRGLCQKYKVIRYGFHGIAHRYMWQRWSELRPEKQRSGKIISLQLGAGCSITAVNSGRAMDTSMGFSPLEGLVMATRSGDIDPGLIPFLQRKEGLEPEELEDILNRFSGLFGVSGLSADMKTLLKSDDYDAQLAIELYCYRARKYIGAYLAVLGGTDAILFGGGVGENAPDIRERILKGMRWCGITLDDGFNRKAIGKEGIISSEDSDVEVRVVLVNEAEILAREAVSVLEG